MMGSSSLIERISPILTRTLNLLGRVAPLRSIHLSRRANGVLQIDERFVWYLYSKTPLRSEQIGEQGKRISQQIHFVAPLPFLTRITKQIQPSSFQLMKHLRRMNTQYIKRPKLNPDLSQRLQVKLQPEAGQLADLLGRDLSSWSSS